MNDTFTSSDKGWGWKSFISMKVSNTLFYLKNKKYTLTCKCFYQYYN